MGMGKDEVVKQSEAAYSQWCERWRKQAKENSTHAGKSFNDLANTGLGKAMVLVANGYSLEKNIEKLKAIKDNVDILCCDKSLKILIEHDIKPTYCLVCDAVVSYEDYMQEVADKLQDTTLLMNVCANPKWSKGGNWKDQYFFVNKDVINSEHEFMSISGCPNVIPAGTNVSNALVVIATQSDERGARNFFAYDKYILVGFDYCWTLNTPYYAFDFDGSGKRNYMRHAYSVTNGSGFCCTSQNLEFSARWLDKYIKAYGHTVVQTSDVSILELGKIHDLADQGKYRFRPEDSGFVKDLLSKRQELLDKIKNEIDLVIGRISKDHHSNVMNSI